MKPEQAEELPHLYLESAVRVFYEHISRLSLSQSPSAPPSKPKMTQRCLFAHAVRRAFKGVRRLIPIKSRLQDYPGSLGVVIRLNPKQRNRKMSIDPETIRRFANSC